MPGLLHQPAAGRTVRRGRHHRPGPRRNRQRRRADRHPRPGRGRGPRTPLLTGRTPGRRILPHLRDRPLMPERYPDGIDGIRLVRKDTPGYFPDRVRRSEPPKEGGTVHYPVRDDLATLLYLAGRACVTPHRWLSKAARLLRPLLDELGLPATLMTTGSRGLHVTVPLDRRAPFDEVRSFARDVADLLAARHPDRLTTAARRQARGGRLYLDVQRNGHGQTTVTPYAVRALPGAPVAAPLNWEELDDPALTARRWTVATVDELLAAADPWAAPARGRSPAAARRRLEKL
ncbi:non-homologous end-joining DNA ligase LigD [Kitasatospora cineracea]|uniref:non-homologous end-joining DNA ligase LigD n=1 Tax=Kitasatospora cineracea TaxID=88074 RepID=UPI001FC99BB9|nr:DNA primase small subunit domain-containing protein [Kitasatospora cineracea]